MHFQTITLYTSDPTLPQAQTAAELLRLKTGLPVQVLSLEQLPVADPHQRQRVRLEHEAAALRRQLQAVEFVLAQGRQNPVLYASDLALAQQDKQRYERRLHQVQGELILQQVKAGEG
ncbi:hypothetical protein [Hymenobacter chitinivorans]|uniref:Uncharacterized protein n=1 Tax=Hymenobacter chitinivorans DSM 11115 TaxID=1121954 RepID=A0A2M9BN86_9BACT|nr:hypothetical protein [Hymenobacter chitinivorans]PJJ59418.1 hypothetical protein CLV45_0835 [Hymenobacter chitinivorans DSM 11115]